MRITVLACPPLDSVTTYSVPLRIHLNSKNSRIAWPRGRLTSSCHRTCHVQSTCHASTSTRHASASTRHASASTRHAHKPLACAMAFAAEHTPQCLPWSAAHATKKHTPAIKRVPKRVPKRLRECRSAICLDISLRGRSALVASNSKRVYARSNYTKSR